MACWVHAYWWNQSRCRKSEPSKSTVLLVCLNGNSYAFRWAPWRRGSLKEKELARNWKYLFTTKPLESHKRKLTYASLCKLKCKRKNMTSESIQTPSHFCRVYGITDLFWNRQRDKIYIYIYMKNNNIIQFIVIELQTIEKMFSLGHCGLVCAESWQSHAFKMKSTTEKHCALCFLNLLY